MVDVVGAKFIYVKAVFDVTQSTLMDVLLGRKTRGTITGDIYISGFLKHQETFKRVSGYCEQNDVHSPALTVRESLVFSAFLRLSPDVKDLTKEVQFGKFNTYLQLDVIIQQLSFNTNDIELNAGRQAHNVLKTVL